MSQAAYCPAAVLPASNVMIRARRMALAGVQPVSSGSAGNRPSLWRALARRISRPVVLGVCLLLWLPGSASAMSVGGVTLPATLQAGDSSLALTGAGVRSKFFFKLYVGALYLVSADDASPAVFAADAPMAITLDILSDKVTRERLIDTLNEGFEQSTSGNTRAIQPGIDTLIELMQAPIVPGDRFSLRYAPASGTHVSKNGEELAVIAGLPFKQALFGIWLGDKPAQASLKKAMLGN